MDNPPKKITILNKKRQKHRIIHLISKTDKKSFRSASAKCKTWILKCGFPITLKVSYGMQITVYGKLEELTNEIECGDFTVVRYALQVFVREYM